MAPRPRPRQRADSGAAQPASARGGAAQPTWTDGAAQPFFSDRRQAAYQRGPPPDRPIDRHIDTIARAMFGPAGLEGQPPVTPPREGGYQRRLRRDRLIGLISTRPGPDTAPSEPTRSPTSLDSSAEREFITVVLEQVHEERDWKVTIDPVRGVTEPMARYVAPESSLPRTVLPRNWDPTTRRRKDRIDQSIRTTPASTDPNEPRRCRVRGRRNEQAAPTSRQRRHAPDQARERTLIRLTQKLLIEKIRILDQRRRRRGAAQPGSSRADRRPPSDAATSHRRPGALESSQPFRRKRKRNPVPTDADSGRAAALATQQILRMRQHLAAEAAQEHTEAKRRRHAPTANSCAVLHNLHHSRR